MFRGIGAYAPDFLSIVQFGVLEHIFRQLQHKYLNHTDIILMRTSYRYRVFHELYIKLQFSASWSIHGKSLS